MHCSSDKAYKNFIILLYILQKILQNYCLANSKVEDDFLIPECFFHDFRMMELLRLKRSLTYEDNNICLTSSMCIAENLDNFRQNSTAKYAPTAEILDLTKTAATDTPAAMALKAEEKGFPSSVDYHSWQNMEEQKPSKLQTLFQITITSLAFLSFGGYLLCLIVQTIKSKGTTYFHPVATATTTTNNGVKRIKVYRRSRRNANTTTPLVYENASFAFFTNSDNEAQELEDDMNSALPNPTDMYNTLLRFAEGYVKSIE